MGQDKSKKAHQNKGAYSKRSKDAYDSSRDNNRFKIFGLLGLIIALLFLMISSGVLFNILNIFGATQTINFTGKIVNKTDGTNVIVGDPACVLAGADTCDFRVRIYDASTAGNILFEEEHTDVEIGDYDGIFSLDVNSICNSQPSGTVDWATTACVSNGGVDFSDLDVYLEVAFAPGGAGSYTEVFTRKAVSNTPSALFAERAGTLEGIPASGFVQIGPDTVQAYDGANSIININENGAYTPLLMDLSIDGTSVFEITNSGGIQMYASDGDTGLITYGVNDGWGFTGGNVGIGTSASPTVGLYVARDSYETTGSQQYAASFYMGQYSDAANYQVYGVSSNVTSTADIGYMYSVIGNGQYSSNAATDTLNDLIGFSTELRHNNGGGSVNRVIGLNVFSTAGTNISNNYGIYLQNLSAGANDYGIYIQGADTYAIWSDAGVNRFDGQTLFGAATVDASSINIASSAATNPTTPNSGDLWWNGTSLYFYNGSTNKDLLAGSLFTDGGAVTYLTSTTDDFTIGGTSLTSAALGVDVDLNRIWVGTGSGTNASILMSASDNGNGILSYTTDDQWLFNGGNVQMLGKLAVGNTGPDPFININSTQNKTDLVATDVYGIYNSLTQSTQGDSSRSLITNYNYTSTNVTLTDLIGVQAVNDFSYQAAAQSVTNSYAGKFGVQNSSSTATISNTYGLYVDSLINSGTVTSNYGLFVGNQTAGTSDYGIYVGGADTYAIWSDAGINRFDGAIQLGSDANNALNLGTIGTGGTSDLYFGDDLLCDVSESNCGFALATAGSLFTDGGATTYLTSTTDDFAIGGTGLASAFSVDASANIVRIGTGSTANSALRMYASDGDTGLITYTTGDYWYLTEGRLVQTYTESGTSSYINSVFQLRVTGNASSHQALAGEIEVANGVGQTYSSGSGVYSRLYFSGSGTATSFRGFEVLPWMTNASGVLENFYGLTVRNQTGSGTINNYYGIYLEHQTLSANGYGLYIEGADTYAIWSDAGVNRFDGAIQLGSDANNALNLGTIGTGGTSDLYFGNDLLCDVSEANCGFALATAGSLFTDGGATTYLTSTTDNLAVGATTTTARLQVSSAAGTSIPAAGTINTSTSLYLTNNDASYGLLGGVLSTGSGWIQTQRTDSTSTTYSLLLNPNGGNVGVGVTSASAFIDIAAATTGAASINISSSAATNPSAPNSGDLWWNGTNLYFYDGSTSNDLLAGGGSSLFTDGGATTYLTSTTDDFAIGGTGSSQAFFVDTSLNRITVGTGSTTDSTIQMIASDGDTGVLSYLTTDGWQFSQGTVAIGNVNPDPNIALYIDNTVTTAGNAYNTRSQIVKSTTNDPTGVIWGNESNSWGFNVDLLSIYGSRTISTYTSNDAGDTLGDLIGGSFRLIHTNGGGSVSVAKSINIESVTGSGITNNYGLFVESQTAGTNDYGIYIAGADTYALWVDSGLSRFDGDINLATTSASIDYNTAMYISGNNGALRLSDTATDNYIQSTDGGTGSRNLYISGYGGADMTQLNINSSSSIFSGTITTDSVYTTSATGISWESGVNSITYNDGCGNVQIRFGNECNGGTKFTHTGTAFYIGGGLDSGSGSLDLYVASNGGAGTGATVTWGSSLSIGASTLTYGGNTIWHAGNDGSGSGLSADTLDGINNTQFLRSDTTGTLTGSLTVTGTYSGNGSGLTTLNASNLSSGTVPDGRITGSYTGLVNLTASGLITTGNLRATGYTGLNGAGTTTVWGVNIGAAGSSGSVAISTTASQPYGLYISDGGMSGGQYSLYAAFDVRANNRLEVGSLATATADHLCINTSNQRLASCTSSIVFKENVQDMPYGLDEVLQLRPVTYNWKEDGTPDLGFIAEEASLIIPEMKSEYWDGAIGLKYDHYTGVLTKAIQELNDIIVTAGLDLNDQQLLIDNLTSNVSDNTSRIDNIETQLTALAGAGAGTQTITDAIISGTLKVDGIVDFGDDTVGEATIIAGDTEVVITFSTSYDTVPFINATPQGINFFTAGISYVVDEKTVDGFKIIIDAPYTEDLVFNWNAFQ